MDLHRRRTGASRRLLTGAMPMPYRPSEAFPGFKDTPKEEPLIRVLVVDDHDFVRAMVTRVLSGAGDIEVVGECQDGTCVLPAAAVLNPDVVLMDVHMSGLSGVDITRDLVAVDPHVRVLILTGSAHNRRLRESVDAGAAGCLLKSGDPQLLISAVREVAAGGSVWPVTPTLSGGAQSAADIQCPETSPGPTR
jgi:DNA-binding NarL/FixJ family response regulator